MGYLYNRRRDQLQGHDYPGLHDNGWPTYEHNEMELGARVAMMLDDPEQWFWDLFGPRDITTQLTPCGTPAMPATAVPLSEPPRWDDAAAF